MVEQPINRGGRPPETGEVRTERLRIRVTVKEREELQRRAAELGYNDVSHYVRGQLLGYRTAMP